LICPIGIKVNIFTDSQATIDAFHNFQQLSFPFTSRQWSKICSNSNLWITLFTLLSDNEIDLTLTKVKAHANNFYNEEADKLASNAHLSRDFLVINDAFNPCLDYVPQWNNITIERRPRKFLTDISWNRGFESFFNLFRNHKYRSNNIHWSSTFAYVNGDSDTCVTNFVSSQKKAHRIKFMTEELPTIEHMKKRRYDLYKDSKCPLCRYCSENFVHVFTCTKSINKIRFIQTKAIKHIMDLLYQHANIKVDITYFSSIPHIWDIDHRNTDTLNFIDIIKGFVPQILFSKILDKAKHNEMTSLIISNFLDFIYTNICEMVWNFRCNAQIELEKQAGITNRMKKLKNSSNNRRPNIDINCDAFNSTLANNSLGVVNKVVYGGSWLDFINWVNQVLYL